jgi:hypothetical protein
MTDENTDDRTCGTDYERFICDGCGEPVDREVWEDRLDAGEEFEDEVEDGELLPVEESMIDEDELVAELENAN